MARRDAPMFVEIPEPGADRPLWGKVGLVAAAGFVIGVAWPRLTSTRIAPAPPADNAVASEPSAPASGAVAVAPTAVRSASAAAASKPVKGAATESAAPVASAAARPPTPAPSPAPTPLGPAPANMAGSPNGAGATAAIAAAPRAPAAVSTREPSVGTGFVLHCRDDQQDVAVCGSFSFDSVAVPKIKGLARCPAARGASGKLSLGFDLDFRAKAVRVLLGKSTNLPREAADGLVHCSEAAFEPTNWTALPHDHRQYTVFYSVHFGEGGPALASNDRAPAASPPASADASSAFIAWDVALLRDTPKSGAVVERLLKGAKVKVLGHDGNWFRVQYGTFTGWVYREAIGL